MPVRTSASLIWSEKGQTRNDRVINTRRSQSIELIIDIGNQSIHSISININRRLLLIGIGNRSQSDSQEKKLSIFIDWQKLITIDNNS